MASIGKLEPTEEICSKKKEPCKKPLNRENKCYGGGIFPKVIRRLAMIDVNMEIDLRESRSACPSLT